MTTSVAETWSDLSRELTGLLHLQDPPIGISWAAEVPEIRAFFDRFGDRLPKELSRSLDALAHELTTASV